MKAILEFELPEEREEFEDATKGSIYKMKIDTLYNDVFRPHIKYDKKLFDDHDLTDEELDIIEMIWKKVSEHLEEE